MSDVSASRQARAPVADALTSRIGRRFVLLFAICALVPLVVFATLSVSRVTSQMHADLRKALHNAAKTSGMGLAANLSQIAGDLAMAAELIQNWRTEGAWSGGEALRRQAGAHCEAIWLLEQDHVEVLLGDGEPPPHAFDEAERAHLLSGLPLVQVVGDTLDLLMTLHTDPADADAPRLCALVRRDWFWDPQVLRAVNCEFVAFDRRGRVLSHTFERMPDMRALSATVVSQRSSATIEWQVGDVPYLARCWCAFLRPQYGLDLWVVQTRARSEAFAVADSFVTWFWLTAAGTLLSVVLASMAVMRRTPGPIMSLQHATRRLGDGDLDARVWIESRDELGDLGGAFNDMAERLQENIARREQTERELVASRDAALQAVKAKAEFVTNVSHEFRTPMAEILGATEILSQIDDDDDGSVREEFANIALHGAQRLARLVDDVLELGQTSGGAREPIDLRSSLQLAIADMPPDVRDRVVCSVDEDLPCVLGDGTRLGETWRRLIDNAAKFSAPDTPIEVRVTRAGTRVLIDFVDRGVGIAPEDQPHVFEPFSQVGRDQMTDKAHGTGLGLTLARSVIESHGGSIRLSSELGKGSTFRISLPLERDTALG
ncbi:MAG TPA: HAMP domain-containing histidine kinase [bacterium]|nr:HAMP domain-containing histidine kinase [bacterium]